MPQLRIDGFTVHAITLSEGQNPRPAGYLLRTATELAAGLERSRLLDFAGIGDTTENAGHYSIADLDLEVVGRQFTLPLGNLAARLTMGVDREVVRSLGEVGSVRQLSDMRAQISPDGARWMADEAPPDGLSETGRAATVARDGCALSIVLE